MTTEAYFTERHTSLVSLAWRSGSGNRDDAEDAVCEARYKCLAHPPREGYGTFTYCPIAVKRTAMDQARRHYRSRRSYGHEEGEYSMPEMSDAYDLHRAMRELRAARPEYWRAIVATEVMGLTFDEYSARSGVTVPAAKAHKWRGLAWLRDYMGAA